MRSIRNLLFGCALILGSVSVSAQCNMLLLGAGKCSSASLGPVAFDAATAGAEVNSTTQTTSHTTGSGAKRFLVAAVGYLNGSGQTVTGVTYNGVALTSTTAQSDGLGRAIQLWYLAAPASGANNLVVTMSATTDVNTGIVTYTGVDQSVPISGHTCATADTAPVTLTVTSAAGDLVFSAITQAAGAIGAVGAGQTERFRDSDANVSLAGSEEAGAASVTMTWAGTAGFVWNHCGFSIEAG